MTFTKFITLVSKLILIGLSASLIACDQNTSTTDQPEVVEDQSDDQPELANAFDLSQYFLIDFETKQVTPLSSSDSHDVIPRAVYQPKNGISYVLTVGDQQTGTPGIYDIDVELTNKTGQSIDDSYGGIRVIVTTFQAQSAVDKPMPGGGIANARYMAESFRPFVLTTDFSSLQSLISPGFSADVAYHISLPAGATKAVISLLTLGSSLANNIPGRTVSYLTPMIGKFKTEDLTSGPAHLTRMGDIQSLAACDGFIRFFDNTYDILWTFFGDNTSWDVVEDFNGNNILEETNVYGIDCFGGDLFREFVLALFDKNILFVGDNTIFGDVIIGTGEPGFKNGFQTEAQFNRPRDVAILGHSIFVADSGNNAIRHVHVNDNGNYFVNTVIRNLDSSPLSVTTDEIGNIYFLLRDGVYRIPLDTNRDVKILTRNIDENPNCGGMVPQHWYSRRPDQIKFSV